MVPSGCTAGPTTLDQAAKCVPVSGWYHIWGMGFSWSLSPSPFCSSLSLILFPGIPQSRAVSHGGSFLSLSAHRAGSRGSSCLRAGPQAVPVGSQRLGAAEPPNQSKAICSWGHPAPPSLSSASVPFSLPPFSFLLSVSVLQTYLSCLLHPTVLFLPPAPTPRRAQHPLWAPPPIQHLEHCILGPCWYKCESHIQP